MYLFPLVYVIENRGIIALTEIEYILNLDAAIRNGQWKYESRKKFLLKRCQPRKVVIYLQSRKNSANDMIKSYHTLQQEYLQYNMPFLISQSLLICFWLFFLFLVFCIFSLFFLLLSAQPFGLFLQSCFYSFKADSKHIIFATNQSFI